MMLWIRTRYQGEDPVCELEEIGCTTAIAVSPLRSVLDGAFSENRLSVVSIRDEQNVSSVTRVQQLASERLAKGKHKEKGEDKNRDVREFTVSYCTTWYCITCILAIVALGAHPTAE